MQARIWTDRDTQELCIAFFRPIRKGEGEIYNPMTREISIHSDGMIIKPDYVMKFPFFESKEIQKSLLEELSQKSTSDEIIRLQTELSATKIHLEDLRSLLQVVLNSAPPAVKGE